MNNRFDLYIYIILFAIVFITLIVSYFAGKIIEKRHYASIIDRENKYAKKVLILAVRKPPSNFYDQQLVVASVVISSDKFKRLIAGLKSLIGRNILTYENLIDRGRREAVLRLKEKALNKDCQYIYNIKYSTSSLRPATTPKLGPNGTVEILVYGTAGKIKRKEI